MSSSTIVDRIHARERQNRRSNSQSIPVSKYLRCYQVLLGDLQYALPSALNLEDSIAAISRDDLAQLAQRCYGGQSSWSELFIATMLWGYGENDDSGPVKLFRALGSSGAEAIISDTAKSVMAGNLETAFCSIRKLTDVGASFGTKFLFACGTASIQSLRPLVLDRILTDALRKLYGADEADQLFGLKSMGYTYQRGMKRAADGYLSYCREMQMLAQSLKWDVYQLEQFLFENSKNL